MFFVIFESTTPSEVETVSAEYYATLQSLLQHFPGFIEETPFSSVYHKDKGVLVASFEDEAAAHRWRKDPTHLRIQEDSRAGIFDNYRIRAGPLLPANFMVSDKTPNSDRMVMLIEETTDSAAPLDLEVLRLGSDFARHVTEIATYKNEEKTIHLVAWISDKAAMEFSRSTYVASCSSVLCVRVMRDYGRVDRKEAPV